MIDRVISVLPTQPVRLGVRLGVVTAITDPAQPNTPAVGVSSIALGDIVRFYFADGSVVILLIDGIGVIWTEVVGGSGIYRLTLSPSTALSLFKPERAGPFQYVVLPEPPID